MNDKSSRCADSATIRPSLRRARSLPRPANCADCFRLCACTCVCLTSRVDTPQTRPRLAATDECMREHRERIGRAVQVQPPRPHVECIIRLEVRSPPQDARQATRCQGGERYEGPHPTAPRRALLPPPVELAEQRMDRCKSTTSPAPRPRRAYLPSSPSPRDGPLRGGSSGGRCSTSSQRGRTTRMIAP
jgi:hypothetical protein